MEMRESSTRPHDMHFVDIHEVPEEEGEKEEEECRENKETKPTTRAERRFNKAKSPHRNLTRQVSLGTGFAVLNRDLEEKKLPRSGNSFGGFGSTRGRDADVTSKVDFSLFRTKSTLVQNNNFSGLLNEPENKSVPAGRYFAALTGPELDQVKDHEDILLPTDKKWPFLLRFPIGCFGICLGLSSQSILWHALAISPATKFLNITPFINFTIWLLALSVLTAVSITYTLKCIFYFEAVKREYFHPVRVNFFFAPWVVCMFLAIGTPSLILSDNHTMHPSVWCAFMIPIAYLDLKIYGQWLSGGKRRLSKVANPSSHLSVVGNFVGAILAAKVGWVEAGKFLWAIGFAHYLVVFVTLYQRLPTSEALPKELHPVYSMFIATPAAASIAWGAIYGEFDGLARTCYFIALFLYCSLIVRINFFTGFRFSVAWWSYTFPMTTASIATIKYAEAAPSPISKGLAITLSLMSSTMVCLLMVSTLLHAFVWRTLFPNDLAIAITKTRQLKEKKSLKKGYNLKGWTKQSPLSLVTSIIKHNSMDKYSEKGEVGESQL